MNRLRRSLFALLVTVVLSLAVGWVLSSAVRPTSVGPIAPIEMPSGGMVLDAPSEQSRGAEPVGPAPPSAGSVTAPAGHRADGEGDEDDTDGDGRDDDDDG